MIFRTEALLKETANASEIYPAETFVWALWKFTLNLQSFLCGRMNCSFLEVLARGLLSHVLVRLSLQWAQVWAWTERTFCVGACMCLCMKIKILWFQILAALRATWCPVLHVLRKKEELGWWRVFSFLLALSRCSSVIWNLLMYSVQNRDCNTKNCSTIWMCFDCSKLLLLSQQAIKAALWNQICDF